MRNLGARVYARVFNEELMTWPQTFAMCIAVVVFAAAVIGVGFLLG